VKGFESGGLTISCTILYPEQFDALRRTYDCEKSMVESLSRCVKWNASGGKSGSAFLKTRGLIPLLNPAFLLTLVNQMIVLLQKNSRNLKFRQWRILHRHILTTCHQRFPLMYGYAK